MDRTSTDTELEELFDLMKHSGEFDSIRSELTQKWDDPEVVEELASLDWESFKRKMSKADPSPPR